MIYDTIDTEYDPRGISHVGCWLTFLRSQPLSECHGMLDNMRKYTGNVAVSVKRRGMSPVVEIFGV